MHQGSVILDGVISYLAGAGAGSRDDDDGSTIRQEPDIAVVALCCSSGGNGWHTLVARGVALYGHRIKPPSLSVFNNASPHAEHVTKTIVHIQVVKIYVFIEA
jgi:hypothetical protein